MAQLVNHSTELWHFNCWASSIQTTSGHYTHYAHDRTPIFPSDFIWFMCLKSVQDCSCQWEEGLHLNRVLSVAQNYQSTAVKKDVVTLKIQVIICSDDLSQNVKDKIFPSLLATEIVVIEDIFVYLPEFSVLYQEVMKLDYIYDSQVKSSLQQQAQQQQQHQRCFVCQVFNAEKQSMCALNKTDSIWAELELEQYTQKYFVNNFDFKQCISVLLLTFIDGFDLYWNMYRTLMSIYLNLAELSFWERIRRSNILTLTLRPHGSNFSDVIEAMQPSLAALNKREILSINDQDIFVCAFTLCYTEDMSQQQENSECISQQVNKRCQFCFVDAKDWDALNLNLIFTECYHHETMCMRQKMKRLSKSQQSVYGRKKGLDMNTPSLISISPALDIILSQLSDSAYSEFEEITKQLHMLLMTAILTSKRQKSYAEQLHLFKYSSGWDCLQSFIHHLGSYSLQKHRQWSVIVPALLCCWLREEYIQSLFENSMLRVFQTDTFSVNVIVISFTAIAKSNILLMSDSMTTEDWRSFSDTVKAAQMLWQNLLEIAALTSSNNSRSRSATPAHVEALSTSTEMSSPESNNDWVTAKALEYCQDKVCSNTHIEFHYKRLLDEYSLPTQCNVLIEKDKHCEFKAKIYHTNYQDVEKVLLGHENRQQTTQLLLINEFAHAELDLTQRMQSLQFSCPALFDMILPRAEKIDHENNSYIDILGDATHKKSTVIDCLQSKHCHDVLELLTRATQLCDNSQIAQHLQDAYEKNYKMPNIVHFDFSKLLWCKKFSFDNSILQHWITYQQEDFIQFWDSIDWLDHILIHEAVQSQWRLFALISKVENCDTIDQVLELSLLNLISDVEAIVRLSAISDKKQYILQVENHADDTLSISDSKLLHVNWVIQFL